MPAFNLRKHNNNFCSKHIPYLHENLDAAIYWLVGVPYSNSYDLLCKPLIPNLCVLSQALKDTVWILMLSVCPAEQIWLSQLFQFTLLTNTSVVIARDWSPLFKIWNKPPPFLLKPLWRYTPATTFTLSEADIVSSKTSAEMLKFRTGDLQCVGMAVPCYRHAIIGVQCTHNVKDGRGLGAVWRKVSRLRVIHEALLSMNHTRSPACRSMDACAAMQPYLWGMTGRCK
jgi:hypothetical protein